MLQTKKRKIINNGIYDFDRKINKKKPVLETALDK